MDETIKNLHDEQPKELSDDLFDKVEYLYKLQKQKEEEEKLMRQHRREEREYMYNQFIKSLEENMMKNMIEDSKDISAEIVEKRRKLTENISTPKSTHTNNSILHHVGSDKVYKYSGVSSNTKPKAVESKNEPLSTTAPENPRLRELAKKSKFIKKHSEMMDKQRQLKKYKQLINEDNENDTFIGVY